MGPVFDECAADLDAWLLEDFTNASEARVCFRAALVSTLCVLYDAWVSGISSASAFDRDSMGKCAGDTIFTAQPGFDGGMSNGGEICEKSWVVQACGCAGNLMGGISFFFRQMAVGAVCLRALDCGSDAEEEV